MERVRTCESGRSAIEIRYFALLQRAGLLCFFQQKYRESAYYFVLL